MNLKNKIILVTGGCGFIGSHLCDELLKHDINKIFIFDNLCQSSIDNIQHIINNKKIEFIKGDIRDYDVIEPLVKKSDFVFNLSASSVGMSILCPRVDLQTNIEGTYNILKAAKNNPKIRIIHASSGSVLGSDKNGMKEDHNTNPSNMYGISKLAGEKYCKFFAKEFDVNITIIRYFHVFGPRQDHAGKSGVINIFLYKVLNGESPIIWGTGNQIQCFTYVLDSVNATIMLAEKDNIKGEIYNIASETRMRVIDLADLIINKYSINKNIKPVYGPKKVGENMYPIPITDKIKKIGWKTKYEFEEGLSITKKWVESITK